MNRRLLTLTLLLGLVLVPLAASADHHEEGPMPVTWLSYAKSQPGQGTPLARYIAEGGAEIYDGLMADGHILTWGVGMPINHHAGDDWNVVEWVTFRDWAAVDAFMQAFMARMMSRDPEEAKADEEKWNSLVEPGSHYDHIVRHMAVERGEGTAPAYYSLAYWPVKQGQSGKLRELWMENAKPTMAGLQESGAIGAYGLAAPEVHDGTTPSYFMFWTAMPNLAAQDAMDAAFDAAAEERGEEAQKAMMEGFAAAVDFSGHHDRILAVIHNGGTAAGSDGQ